MAELTDMVESLVDQAVEAGYVEPARAAGLRETVKSGNPNLAFDFLISHLDDTDVRPAPAYFAYVVLVAYKLGVFTEPDPAVNETDVGTQRILRATVDRLDENVDYDE